MIIQKAKWKKCGECGRNDELIQQELFGCDNCKKKFGSAKDGMGDYLELTVHEHNGKHHRMEFCSWGCVFKKLKTVKTDYFVSLPFLNFDVKTKGQTPKDFWKAIKTFKA